MPITVISIHNKNNIFICLSFSFSYPYLLSLPSLLPYFLIPLFLSLPIPVISLYKDNVFNCLSLISLFSSLITLSFSLPFY